MKIKETLLGKIEVIRNWCWYYEEILESFSQIIPVKLERIYEEILKKLVGNTSPKLKKNILMETLWNFQGNFWRILRKIVQELQLIL